MNDDMQNGGVPQEGGETPEAPVINPDMQPQEGSPAENPAEEVPTAPEGEGTPSEEPTM